LPAGLVLASLSCACLLAAAAASAATRVKPVALVGPLKDVIPGSLAIATDGRGDRFASWSVGTPAANAVSVAERRAGRPRWKIHRLLAYGSSPTLAVDGRGDAVVIWRASNPHALENPGVLEAAVKSAGSARWSPAKILARFQPSDGSDPVPDMAIGASGEILIVWSEGSEEEPDTPLAEEPGQSIEVVTGSAKTGRFDGPKAISPSTDFLEAPRAALDGRGDAVVVWEAGLRGPPLFERAIQAAWRPAGSGWRAPTTLARSREGLADPRVAIDEQGRAVAVWERGHESPLRVNGETPSVEVESAFGSASASAWGPTHELSPAGEPAGNVQLAASPTGRLVAAWEGYGRTSNAVVAAVGSTPSGRWEAPSTITTWGHVAPSVCREGPSSCVIVRQPPRAAPRVAIDARGDATIAWEQAGGYNAFIRAARRPATSRTWLTALRVSAPATSDVDVALDGSGGAALIWRTVGPCPGACLASSLAIDVAELPRPAAQ
jgi:hypothetical protein